MTSVDRVTRTLPGSPEWADLLAQIGGDRVQVTSILSNPNADPHEYESSVRDATPYCGCTASAPMNA